MSGPDTPPAGVGSFQFAVPSHGKVTLSTGTVAGTQLSEVDAVSYATYRESTSTMPPDVDPSLNIEVCADGVTATGCANGSYTTLVWEPVYAFGAAAITADTWQTWDALAPVSTNYDGGWWSTHPINGVCASTCYRSLAEIQAANPDAVILSFGVNVGGGPAGTFEGNADALTLGLNGATTTYDLEPTIALTSKNQCKQGGWMTSNTPVFRNQGDCVSYIASNGTARPNR